MARGAGPGITAVCQCPHPHQEEAVYGPDPAGPVAVTRERTGTWGGRWLAAGEDALPTEKRSVHECDGTRHHAQRGNWAATLARQRADQRRGRGRRPGPPITGARVPPPLPGMEKP